MTKLNTLEKLTNIEKRLSLLLQSLESIPEEKLELMKKIKDSERRTRYCVPQWLNVPPSAHLAIEFFTCKNLEIFSVTAAELWGSMDKRAKSNGKNRIPWLETSFCFLFFFLNVLFPVLAEITVQCYINTLPLSLQHVAGSVKTSWESREKNRKKGWGGTRRDRWLTPRKSWVFFHWHYSPV